MTDSKETFVGECSMCGKKLRMPIKYKDRDVKCKSCRTAPPPVAAPTCEDPAQPASMADDVQVVAPSASTSDDTQASERERPQLNLAPVEDGVDPDALLRDFRGVSKVAIFVVVALVLHVVVILGTSREYLMTRIFGPNTEEMSKEERVQVALGEAQRAIEKIADHHGLSTQDIIKKIGAGGSRAAKLDKKEAAKAASKKVEKKKPEPKEGPKKSEFEKDLQKAKKGPDEPMIDENDATGL